MKYLKLIFPVLIFLIGVQFLLDHFVRNPAKLADYEMLISKGQDTEAVLAEEYKVTEVAGVESENKTISYSYTLNGQQYTQEERVAVLPKIDDAMKINIKYLPSNPNVSSVNPTAALANQKELSDGSAGIWLGLAAIVIGGFLFLSRFKSMKAEEQQA